MASRILLAVSGGIDSMYLANSAARLFPGAEFALAHCNFSLRSEESDGDEAFVRNWCKEHGIKCFVKRFDTKSYASANGISIEMAARELRYTWFKELLQNEGYDAVAVAHNANDNAETLLLNLLRGAGSRGLRGMASEAPLLRPLLGLSREDIQKEMLRQGWRWREDSTNAVNDCKRNKLRNQVFPVFAEINPSFVQTFSRNMQYFRQTDDIADDYFNNARKQITVKAKDGREQICVDALLELKHWEYVLFRILEPCSFSRNTLDKLKELLLKYKTEPRGTVTLAGKCFESPSHTLKAIKGGKLAVYSIEEI